MDQIPLVKQIRTSQILIGSLSILYFIFNFFGSIFFTTPKDFEFYIFLVIYFVVGIFGLLLILRRNTVIYPILGLFIIDLVWMLIAFVYILFIYDGIVIFLCIQFISNYKKYKDEMSLDHSDQSLILEEKR